jgi:hypothetical protein
MLAGTTGCKAAPLAACGLSGRSSFAPILSGNMFCHPLVTRHEFTDCDRLGWFGCLGVG